MLSAQIRTQKKPSMKTHVCIFFKAVSSICLILAISGCSAFLQSPIPGAKNKVTTDLKAGLEYQTALTAIKVAIGQAILDFKNLQRQHPQHPMSTLDFKTGNGTLTTTVQKEVTDAGGITLLIPFSGLVGTTATPGLDLGRGATSKRTEKFAFAFEPSSMTLKDKSPVDIRALKNVTIENGISEALVTAFSALASVPASSGIALQPRELTYTFQFVVTRTGTGKITVSILPTTPTLRNLGPNVSSKRTDTTTNELTITLPFAFATPMAGSQPMTFFYQVHGTNGSAWIQSPYTAQELKKVIGELTKTVPESTGSGVMELQGLLKQLNIKPLGADAAPNGGATPPKPKLAPAKPNLVPPADPPSF
jgi:hypothetical protein